MVHPFYKSLCVLDLWPMATPLEHGVEGVGPIASAMPLDGIKLGEKLGQGRDTHEDDPSRRQEPGGK